MQFVIDKRSFVDLVTSAKGAVEPRSPVVILQTVRLVAAGSEVTMDATDLTLVVQTRCRAEVASAGVVCVTASDLFSLVKVLPREGRSVRMEVSASRWVRIVCGGRVFRLTGIQADDFPNLPDSQAVEFHRIGAAELSALFAATQFSLCKDDTRPHLAAALLELTPGRARMVTTDGHRLSRADCRVDGLNVTASLLLPSRAVRKIKQVVGRMTAVGLWSTEFIEVGLRPRAPGRPDVAFFRCGRMTLSSKLVDARFPSYEQVIPFTHERTVTVSRMALADAVRAVSEMASVDAAKIVVAEGRVVVSSPEDGEAGVSEEIKASLQGGGLTFGVNSRFLFEVLKSIDAEDVMLELSGELDPFVVRPVGRDDYLHILMPLRI